MYINVLRKEESYEQHMDKIMEEAEELYEELKLLAIFHTYNGNVPEKILSLAAGEAFDVIQVAIGVLDKLQQDGLNIGEALNKHNDKLSKRGWEFKGKLIIVEE